MLDHKNCSLKKNSGRLSLINNYRGNILFQTSVINCSLRALYSLHHYNFLCDKDRNCSINNVPLFQWPEARQDLCRVLNSWSWFRSPFSRSDQPSPGPPPEPGDLVGAETRVGHQLLEKDVSECWTHFYRNLNSTRSNERVSNKVKIKTGPSS